MTDPATEEKQFEGETVLISRRALRERSAEVEALSETAAQVGAEQVSEGEETLASAKEIAAAGRATLAAGVSSVTRGVDALDVSERAALLSETVAAAGVRDMAQGAELLAASDDLAVMSAVVAGMSSEDLERGMDLAAIYGELSVVSDVVAALDMPAILHGTGGVCASSLTLSVATDPVSHQHRCLLERRRLSPLAARLKF